MIPQHANIQASLRVSRGARNSGKNKSKQLKLFAGKLETGEKDHIMVFNPEKKKILHYPDFHNKNFHNTISLESAETELHFAEAALGVTPTIATFNLTNGYWKTLGHVKCMWWLSTK